MINGTTNGFSDTFSVISLEEKENLREKWRRKKWRSFVCLVTVGILVSMLMGLDLSWSATAAALALIIVIDFKNAQNCLEKVSYLLLIFFCGMFISVDGFNRTGIPSTLWDFMEPYARLIMLVE